MNDDNPLTEGEIPDASDIIFLTFQDEWAKLIRRMGAQLSKDEPEVVAFALRHLDTLLNLTVDSPVVIQRRGDGQIDVGTIMDGAEDRSDSEKDAIGLALWQKVRQRDDFDKLEVWRHGGWKPAAELDLPALRAVRWRLAHR